MKYFPKDRYFVDEEALLEGQKRKLAMKYHPDRWWRESDFVAMMEEYSNLKSNFSVRRTSEPKPTVEKPRPMETEYPLWIEVFAWICEAIKTVDGILSAVPSNFRWFLLFFTATFSLMRGFGVLYVVLVVASLLKKNWLAFFACFLVPVQLFETVGFTPEWFTTFIHGIWALPILAAIFVPWFVEDDGRTNEERMESIRRSGAKLASWL